jgi:hypothetical protein
MRSAEQIRLWGEPIIKYEYYPGDEAPFHQWKAPRCALFNEPRFVEGALGFFPLSLLCSERLWNPSEPHSVSSRADGTSGQGVELTTYVHGVSRVHMWWIKAIIDT